MEPFRIKYPGELPSTMLPSWANTEANGCDDGPPTPVPTVDRASVPFKLAGPGGPFDVSLSFDDDDRHARIFVDYAQVGPTYTQGIEEARWVFERRVWEAFNIVVWTCERIGQRTQ